MDPSATTWSSHNLYIHLQACNILWKIELCCSNKIYHVLCSSNVVNSLQRQKLMSYYTKPFFSIVRLVTVIWHLSNGWIDDNCTNEFYIPQMCRHVVRRSAVASYSSEGWVLPWQSLFLSSGRCTRVFEINFKWLFSPAYLVYILWNCTRLDAISLKSTLVQVMAWWRQPASHYLSHCW